MINIKVHGTISVEDISEQLLVLFCSIGPIFRLGVLFSFLPFVNSEVECSNYHICPDNQKD